MSQLSDKSVSTGKPGEPAASPGSTAGWSAGRVFLLGAVVIVGVVAALLLGIRTFLFPVWEANSEGARQVATAEAQLSVARTQEALAPRPTSTVLAAAPQPTAMPTPAPEAVLTVTAQVAAGPTAAAVGAVAPATLPTPTADQAAEIAGAYKRYFDVRSEALLNLDPSPLDEVAAGESLAGLQESIEQDRVKGRALQTNVEHDVYVLDVDGDQADVADRYKDSSIYVDPVSHTPLAGQVAPAAPDVAPAVSVVYHLQRIDGTWKVVSGQRYVPQGSQ